MARAAERRPPSVSSTRSRRFDFAARTSSASRSKPGATTTSRKIETSRSATARSTSRVRATTPAERGDGIPGERGLPGLEQRRALGGATGVRVLDDDAGGAAELARDGGRGRRIQDVVVRERLALERRVAAREGTDLPVRAGPPVARCRLVGVLAVAERLDLLEARRSGSAGTGRRRRAVPGQSGQLEAGVGHPARQLGRRSARRRRPCGGRPRRRGRPGRRRTAPRRRRPRAPRGGPRSAPARSRSRPTAWFLAAARTIDGPPMSISSTSSSRLIPGRSAATANG